jgi:hypothetical protein
MARAKKRRVRLGASTGKHNERIGIELRNLGRIVHDMHFAPAGGHGSCEQVLRQLGSAHALLGSISAHVSSLPKHDQRLSEALDRQRKDVHNAERKFLTTCSRS